MTESTLISYGFQFTGTCNCDGYKTDKYKFEGWQVKWRRTKYQFKLKQNGITVSGWMPVSKLNEVLEQYIPQSQAEKLLS